MYRKYIELIIVCSLITALKQEQIILKMHEFLNLHSFQRSIAKATQVMKTDGNKVEVQLAQYFISLRLLLTETL